MKKSWADLVTEVAPPPLATGGETAGNRDGRSVSLSSSPDTSTSRIVATASTSISVSEYCNLSKAVLQQLLAGELQDDYEVRGIQNPRNLCFRNATIQCLMALPAFRELLLQMFDTVPKDKRALPVWSEIQSIALLFRSRRANPASHIPAPPPKPSPQHVSPSSDASSSIPLTLDSDEDWVVAGSKKKGKAKDCSGSGAGGKSGKNFEVFKTDIVLHSDKVMPNLMAAFTAKMKILRRSTSWGSESQQTPGGGLISGQEDAMEFMTFLLDSIHEEMLSEASSAGDDGVDDAVMGLKTTELVDDDDVGGWEEVASSRISRIGSRAKTSVDEESRKLAISATGATPISRLFHGILRSDFKQQGKTISATFQRFHCLTLECRDFGFIGTKMVVKSIPSLEKAMDIFFSPEKITDSNSIKCLSLDVLPPILMIQFNRFTFDPIRGTAVKIEADISYPPQLQLSDSYLTADLKMRQGGVIPQYSLVAVALHIGNRATGGHYMAMCKGSHGRWMLFDDTKVQQTTEGEALKATKQAYLLYYTKKR